MPGESAWPTSYDYNWCENTAQGNYLPVPYTNYTILVLQTLISSVLYGCTGSLLGSIHSDKLFNNLTTVIIGPFIY